MRLVTSVFTAAAALGLLSASPAAAQKGDRTRLMPEEIATKPEVTNAYDAIRSFRPNFLRVRARGDASASSSSNSYGTANANPEPALYIDETRFDRLDELKNLPVSALTEIKMLTESEASVRFGPGHPYGVIMVTTNRRK